MEVPSSLWKAYHHVIWGSFILIWNMQEIFLSMSFKLVLFIVFIYCMVFLMLMLAAYAISYKTLKIENRKVNEYNLGVTCYCLQHVLEIFANYSRFWKFLIYTKPDSVLSSFMVLQIELKPVAFYFWTVFHCTWSYKISEWSSVPLGPCSEGWVLCGLGNLPIFVAFCCCCEL